MSKEKQITPVTGETYLVEITDPKHSHYKKQVKVKWGLFNFYSLIDKSRTLFLSQVKVIEHITDSL